MIDLDSITTEWLWQHLGEHVHIETAEYPGRPAVGVLRDVGVDARGIAGFCAVVHVYPGRDRFVPVYLIAHYRLARLADLDADAARRDVASARASARAALLEEPW